MAEPFTDHRRAALALLHHNLDADAEIPPKVGNFLGACIAYRELTPRMVQWLDKLLGKAGLPPVA